MINFNQENMMLDLNIGQKKELEPHVPLLKEVK